MITPTVGRIVWIKYPNQEEPLAAIVTKVISDDVINVCCFADTGSTQAMHDVPLIYDTADGDYNVMAPYATWMPYQRAQSEKTEGGTLSSLNDQTLSPFSTANRPTGHDDLSQNQRLGEVNKDVQTGMYENSEPLKK